jgi:ABC-2 type transport system ATP-binding protein
MLALEPRFRQGGAMTQTTAADGPGGILAAGARGSTIAVDHLTKRFGPVLAVDDLSFSVEPGRVTGFLGPNGAGKTTTLRCLLGLVAPTEGTATIGGQPYHDIHAPARVVGAALEATGFHPGRSARNHLRVLARAGGIEESRSDEVLALVGLSEVGDRAVGGFSLGMRQRLQLAAALLGDPGVLVLDEPANGLDPEGIAWLRAFLRHLAGQGRTILVSSHVLSEVEQTVDDVVIIARGVLVRACPLADLTETSQSVVVRTPQAAELTAAVGSAVPGASVVPQDDGSLLVHGADAPAVGRAAFGAQVELHELRAATSDLEQVFLSLTTGDGS